MKYKAIISQRIVGLLIGCYMLFFGILPYGMYGIRNAGVITLVIFGVIWVVLSLVPTGKHQKVVNRLWWINASVTGAGIAVCLVMLSYANFRVPTEKNPSETVVVLGCQVIEDQPSLMLKKRLDVAIEILESAPEAKCVVSGGKSLGKQFSEAEVMYRYLTDNGIEKARIIKEEQATSTEENLKYAAMLIEEQGISKKVTIATDGFHQLRAGMYAWSNGLTPYSAPSRSPWGLVPSYYARELLALAKAVVLDFF